MFPILYGKDEKLFNTLGYGMLSEATDCTVSESRNAEYELRMTYPVTGLRYKDLVNGRIIYATHDDTQVKQPFRIYGHTAPMNGLVTFYARHITQDLSRIVVAPFTAPSPSAAMANMQVNGYGRNEFEFWTDISSTTEMTLDRPSSMRSVLGGMQGSILDTYGGEYEWDHYSVKLHARRGIDTNVTIRYGKNLMDVRREYDEGDTYNSVVPFWAGQNGTSNAVVVGSGIVFGSHGIQDTTFALTDASGRYIGDASGNVLGGPHSGLYTVPLDLTAEFQSMPTIEQLMERAQAILSSDTHWQPKDNIKVDFVALWQTEEYANVAALQRLRLCDTCSVYYPSLGITAEKQKVVKTVYDTLTDRYRSIEIGVSQSSLGQSITGGIQEQIKTLPTTSQMQAAIDHATSLLTGGLGGHVVFQMDGDGKPTEILVMDTDDVNTAVNVLRINVNGIGFSNTGIGGPYKSAWTLDGRFVADFIQAGNINASLITTGSLLANLIKSGRIESKNGRVYFDLDNNEIAAARLISPSTEYSTSKYVTVDVSFTGTASAGEIGICRVYNSTYNDSTIYLVPYYGQAGADHSVISCKKPLKIASDADAVDAARSDAMVTLYPIGGSTNLPDAGYISAEVYNSSGSQKATAYMGDGTIGLTADSIPVQTSTNTSKGLIVTGSFKVNGTKSRIADTDDYGRRLLYCYEMPTPIFGDIGECELDEDGICYVEIDDIFTETVAAGVEYQVFLQAEGDGKCYVSDKQPQYFVVTGTPGLKVAWEIKAKQRGYEYTRIEEMADYGDEYEDVQDTLGDISDYINEQEGLLT